MALSLPQMAALSRLLDEALPLDAVGRRSWLESLAPEHQDLLSVLRDALLPEQSRSDVLSTLPKLDPMADDSSAADSGLQPGALLGPYELIRLLGTGGMAEVWLARRADGAIKREVALKLPLLLRMRRDLEPRFAREREILASLSHPNIARLYDAGIAQGGQPYLALEYVDGVTITAYCYEQRLSIPERLELFKQVLSAVQYAHSNLVIHRDLKPSNILVTRTGEVRLLDFGIAKLLTEGEAKETQLTRISGRALTPDYGAPEQILGTPITTAADVYALGVILYELLTGERPYRLRWDTRGALEEAILQAEPLLPSRAVLKGSSPERHPTTVKKLTKILRGDLDTITLKALRKVPTQRYATASEFGEDITRYLRGDVVLARPDKFSYRVIKFSRRHWLGVTSAALVMLILAAGLSATTYEANVAAKQRDLALQARLLALTQTAAARLSAGHVNRALSLIFEVLPEDRTSVAYLPDALGVFEEAVAADARLSMLSGHTGFVVHAEFSPDDKRIVTAAFDKTARVWDTATGLEIVRLTGHTDRLWGAAFSPDGLRIVTASLDKTARIWDASSGRELMRLSGHTAAVRWAAFSPDGSRIITASDDKTARIWDAVTGNEVLRLVGHDGFVHCGTFSADSLRVVTGSADKTARIWDARTGKQLLVLAGHTDTVRSAAFSSDGKKIVTGSLDRTARVWNAFTGEQQVVFAGHTDRVTSAMFSPDGQQVITSSADYHVGLWSVATGSLLRWLDGHSDSVNFAAYSRDGRLIVSASSDRTARLWSVANERALLRLTGHTGRISNAAFSHDGRKIATSSYDNTARIWDAVSGQPLRELIGHTDRLYAVRFSPDDRQIVTASEDGTARIWDTSSGRELAKLVGHKDRLQGVAFSADGTRVVTSSSDKTVRIWNAADGAELLQFRGHTEQVGDVDFSPDSRRVVSAGDDTARIWNSTTGQQLITLNGHTGSVFSAQFSADGRRIVTTGSDGTARIWDATSGNEIRRFTGDTNAPEAASFSPDGAQIITASLDKTARIWDVASGNELLLLSGHTDRVASATYSPDGQRVLTASFDGSAMIWDARTVPIPTQITWAKAAEFDPLSRTERSQLGLHEPDGGRDWPADPTRCDEFAAAPYDPDRRSPGVASGKLSVDLAITACAESAGRTLRNAQLTYQRGRALVAHGEFDAGRNALEQAVAAGYRASNIDLGRLLLEPRAAMLDPRRAISLYQLAWQKGVTIAAYELGTLLEHGLADDADDTLHHFAPDITQAWAWYRKGADSGEPNALARFAARELRAAFPATDPATSRAHLLDAFTYYAAATERARQESWPDDEWVDWRHHRASLARLLAHDGNMSEVADAYTRVQHR